MIIEVTASRMANAYTEKVLKAENSSIWERNYWFGCLGPRLTRVYSVSA